MTSKARTNQNRTPRPKRREVPHWSVITYEYLGEDLEPTHHQWVAVPYRGADLREFKPYFSLSPDEFDRNLRKSLPDLLHWLADRYPTTAAWPVFFEDGAPAVSCGRAILK